VVQTAAPYPDVGGGVTWESGPAGRGRVTERVVAYAPGDGQALEVADDSMTGHQTVAFVAVPAGVQVTLQLEYRLNRWSPLTPVVDLLFIRRQMTQSLARTLDRFGARLRSERGPADLPWGGRPAGPAPVSEPCTDTGSARSRHRCPSTG
jgi:hypothetical protein